MRYILSEPNAAENWTGEIGRMSDDIAASLFDVNSTCHSDFCLVCGPLPFNELCERTLRSVGFTANRLHFFRG